jgi:anti-anti-sigma factor
MLTNHRESVGQVMEFAQEQTGDVVIVRVVGRLDGSSAQPAEDSFTRLLSGGAPHLAIDMSKLDYISSAGLRVLLVVARRMQLGKGKIVLFGLLPNVREVFAISGFDKIFSIHTDAEAAIAAIG